MAIKHIEDFKMEALRIALSSSLPRAQIAGDFGVGRSTLIKWISEYRLSGMPVAPQADLAKENERMRLENRILKEEREILKKATQFFASQKS
jgi:transposase